MAADHQCFLCSGLRHYSVTFHTDVHSECARANEGADTTKDASLMGDACETLLGCVYSYNSDSSALFSRLLVDLKQLSVTCAIIHI